MSGLSKEKESGVEAAIEAVMQNLTDSQEALVEIGEKLEDPKLKHFFLAESLKRAEFRGELESALNQEGVSEMRERAGTGNALHRAWSDLRFRLRFTLRTGGDRTLLATAEQGEDAAREVYGNAINSRLPQPIRQLLSAQAAHIRKAHDFVKAARNRMRGHAA